jgi:riboflavin-specific deaminase-like protein
MQRPPQTAEDGAFAELRGRAWRLLLEAAAARRVGAAPRHLDSGWLTGGGEAGGGSGPDAPEAVRAFLDLYGPLVTGPEPVTVAHLGQSLDGQIATASGDSYYVTGPDNVTHLHRLRALCAAVVVGAGTVERDDPRLTVRHVEGPQPVRVVLDPTGRLPVQRRVFTDGAAATLVVHAEGLPAPAPGAAEVLAVPCEDGRLDLAMLLAKLRERGLPTVFVEGGGATVSRFLAAGLLDRLHVAIAPLIIGSGRPGLALPGRDRIAQCVRPGHRVYAMGNDILFDCDLRAAAPAPSGATEALTRVR